MLRYLAAIGVFIAAPAYSQNPPEAAALTELPLLDQRAADAVDVLNGARDAETVFDAVFLAEVPPDQLATMAAGMEKQFGALMDVASIEAKDEFSGEVIFRFEKVLAHGTIFISPAAPHKIIGLRLTSFDTLDDSLARITADAASLPGDVGVLFTALGPAADPVLSINPDTQFAIGSTFKLYILSALARQVEAGDRQWSDVLILDRKSFPSGQLQNWPDGSPLTLHTLATLMISISDNTAADILLRELGRGTVEAEMHRIGHSSPNRTLPFLSTLEMFALKGSEGNLRKYAAADEAGRRAILADFEDDIDGNRDLIEPPRFAAPTAIDTVEWFASPQDLALLARRLSEIKDPAARAIMAVNTALPPASVRNWVYVGYKGGSEPGVLNQTWLLQGKGGQWYVLTLSWNNPEAAVDGQTLQRLAERLVQFAQ